MPGAAVGGRPLEGVALSNGAEAAFFVPLSARSYTSPSDRRAVLGELRRLLCDTSLVRVTHDLKQTLASLRAAGSERSGAAAPSNASFQVPPGAGAAGLASSQSCGLQLPIDCGLVDVRIALWMCDPDDCLVSRDWVQGASWGLPVSSTPSAAVRSASNRLYTALDVYEQH